MDRDYQTSRKVYNLLPTLGKGIFDKALLGRISAKKTLNKEERMIAKNIPPQPGHKTYPVERALTNPLVAGAVAGAIGVGLKSFKPKYMKMLFNEYEKHKGATDTIGKTITRMTRRALIDPEKVEVIPNIERLNEIYKPSKQQLANKFVSSGALGVVSTGAARLLHPRALMGEIMQEHKKVKQRDPSEYIRTKLRDDIELKHKGHSMVKESEKSHIGTGATVGTLAGTAIGAGVARDYLYSPKGRMDTFNHIMAAGTKYPNIRYIDLRSAAMSVLGGKKALPYVGAGLVAGAVAGHFIKEKEKTAMDNSVKTIIEGVAVVMEEKIGGFRDTMVEGGASVAKKVTGYMKGQAMNMIAHPDSEVGKIKSVLKGSPIMPNEMKASMKSEALKKQITGGAVVGGATLAAGIGAKSLVGGKKNDEQS